ncbi:hypothetical protein Gotur_034687, partial [Gossypium turneri]
MNETLELVKGRTDGFDSMEEQLREFVLDFLGANVEKMNELVNSIMEKLAEKDENLEDMLLAMKKEIEELKGSSRFTKCKVRKGCGQLVENEAILPSDGMSLRSTYEKRGGNAIETWEEFQRELKKYELMLQISDLSEKEAFYWFEDGLKPADSTSGKRKPRDAKRGSNNPRDKGKMIKCFLCQGPHMVQKYPKKSMILAIKKKDESKKEVKPIEKKTSKVNLMVLIPKERNGGEGLMFVDINIVGTKVLSLIQLVENVSYERNIYSIEQNATEAPSKKLVEHETNLRPVKSTVEWPSSGKLGKVVGPLSKFLSKEAKGLWAVRSQDVRMKEILMGTSRNW